VPGWQVVASHGVPSNPIEFILNFGLTGVAVGWYVDGVPVRADRNMAFGGGSIVIVGAALEGAGRD
jgi:hypothetical protein